MRQGIAWPSQRLRWFACTYIATLLTTSVALAFAPEGFENFAVLNNGKSTAGVSTVLQYSNPAWTSDHESLEAIGNVPLFEKDLLTFGGQVTVANTWGDRSAYFARYDWLLGRTMSLSLKWAHEDWKYISASKDAFGLELNTLWALGKSGGVYFGGGVYHRLLRQRWDEDWWIPLNSRTKDRETYFSGVLGFKMPITQTSFYTVDINTRDAWGYYGLDHIAWDGAFYLGGKGLFFKITAGIRTSAMWMGTAYAANPYVGFGFVAH